MVVMLMDVEGQFIALESYKINFVKDILCIHCVPLCRQVSIMSHPYKTPLWNVKIFNLKSCSRSKYLNLLMYFSCFLSLNYGNNFYIRFI